MSTDPRNSHQTNGKILIDTLLDEKWPVKDHQIFKIREELEHIFKAADEGAKIRVCDSCDRDFECPCPDCEHKDEYPASYFLNSLDTLVDKIRTLEKKEVNLVELKAYIKRLEKFSDQCEKVQK